jgi:hypothetical protein
MFPIVPLHKHDVLNMVEMNFDDVYQQLSGQMKLIAELRHELAETAADRAARPVDGTEKPRAKKEPSSRD